MTIQVNQAQKFKYEIDLDEKGEVVACFRETIILLTNTDGQHLATSNHRDVISLDEIKTAIAKLST